MERMVDGVFILSQMSAIRQINRKLAVVAKRLKYTFLSRFELLLVSV